jgi:hypothetical protein
VVVVALSYSIFDGGFVIEGVLSSGMVLVIAVCSSTYTLNCLLIIRWFIAALFPPPVVQSSAGF